MAKNTVSDKQTRFDRGDGRQEVPVAAGTSSQSGLVQFDSAAADFLPPGSASAGGTLAQLAAYSDHVHPYTSAEPLTSGEAIYARPTLSGGLTLTTQVLALSYWTAATSGTATAVTTQTAGTAASGLTYANVGIYSVAANGNLTLLASTGDLHTTLWIATYTNYASALGTSFTRVAGTRYALGCLAVGTTPPQLVGISPYSGNFMTIAPSVAEQVTGQSTLPSSVSAGSLANASSVIGAIVAP